MVPGHREADEALEAPHAGAVAAVERDLAERALAAQAYPGDAAPRSGQHGNDQRQWQQTLPGLVGDQHGDHDAKQIGHHEFGSLADQHDGHMDEVALSVRVQKEQHGFRDECGGVAGLHILPGANLHEWAGGIRAGSHCDNTLCKLEMNMWRR
jgi:hypothetical protein